MGEQRDQVDPLRTWRVTTEDAQVWQAPLEDALAGRRLGSASLKALHACLERMAHGLEAESDGQQDGGECRCSF